MCNLVDDVFYKKKCFLKVSKLSTSCYYCRSWFQMAITINKLPCYPQNAFTTQTSFLRPESAAPHLVISCRGNLWENDIDHGRNSGALVLWCMLKVPSGVQSPRMKEIEKAELTSSKNFKHAQNQNCTRISGNFIFPKSFPAAYS